MALRISFENIVQTLLDRIEPSAKVASARIPGIFDRFEGARVDPCERYVLTQYDADGNDIGATGRSSQTGQWFLDDRDEDDDMDLGTIAAGIKDGTQKPLAIRHYTYDEIKKLIIRLEPTDLTMALDDDEYLIIFS